jgi:ribosomal protein S12 methylthiotransferase
MSHLKSVALVSLGCAKNLVDSEVVLGGLRAAGYALRPDPATADVIVVNTCGFIAPAREEAEVEIRRALRLKRRDPHKTVVVAGCYVERDGPRLRSLFPQVDLWTGVRDFDRLAALLAGRAARPRRRTFLYDDLTPRVLSTPRGWAYVKISEGCSHRCAFCAIPSIKGPYRSRNAASILREAEDLVAAGVREINLISQDSTFYGRDFGRREGLARLLESLCRVPGLSWIRVLYGYPGEVTDRLLEVMGEPKICAYLDLPFQHADPAVLRGMGRGLDGRRALALLEKIRTRLPGVAIRTSLIVGFPGEGRKAFAGLRGFVAEARFDHLGVFLYSPEPGTPAFGRPVRISRAEAEREEIMALQAGISLEKNRGRIGGTVEVLCESRRAGRGARYAGRTRFQAPEVDGIVIVDAGRPEEDLRGVIRPVAITSAGVYDLRGTETS